MARFQFPEQQIRSWIEAEGKSYSEVAKLLNKPLPQVYNFCKRKEIKSQHISGKNGHISRRVIDLLTPDQLLMVTEGLQSGKTYDEIGDLIGIERRSVSKIVEQLGLTHEPVVQHSPHDTPENVSILREMSSQGCTLKQMAERLGSSTSAMGRLCDRHKIVVSVEIFKAQQSQKMIKAWEDEEKRKATSIKALECGNSPTIRLLLSDKSKSLWADPEYRQKQIEIQREVWRKPEMLAKLAQMRANQPRVSSLQTTLYSILDDLGVKYFREYDDKNCDKECIIGPYVFDCVIPRPGKTDLLVECQGDYWHSQERHIRSDRGKATYISANFPGYELKYLWEHEFKEHNRIIETIKYWLGITKLELRDFEFDQVSIKPAAAPEYKLLLSKYHYLANAGRGGIAFGAFIGDQLIAICVFSPLVRQNIELEGLKWSEIKELSRLCIDPRYQKKNFASWFVSRATKLLSKDIKAIISYCDTTFNHDGAIYKALNYTQDKVVRPDYWYTNQEGWVMHKKTLYNHASKMGMIENDYAEAFGYKRVYGTDKLRFVLRR
jgi:transposase